MVKKNFKNKKILVMGLGLHGGGVGAAKFFCAQDANVLVTDLKSREQLQESIKKLHGLKIRYVLGRHEKADFLWPDLIIKNPDVANTSPYLEIARKNNVLIETDISLFFKLSEAFIIGVTGTKGKSTTASLIYHILKQHRPIGIGKVFLAGNIGVSPLELLPKLKKDDKVVLELSSFALEDLTQSPNMAVITNILPDHLNRYASMAEYIEAKKIIFKNQKKGGVLILNADDPVVKGFAKESTAEVFFFSTKERPKEISLSGFKPLGDHNLSNLLAAVKVAVALKIPPKVIERALSNFKGIPSRQEFIREVNGVKYFNDTTSTMPDATIAASRVFLENFPNSRLILICGGQNKGLEYNELAKIIRERIDELIMLPGTASDKIKEELRDYTRTHEVFSMQKAVKKAKELSRKGDIVILSPGAASFNLFKNEFDRGKQFVQAVKKIPKKT